MQSEECVEGRALTTAAMERYLSHIKTRKYVIAPADWYTKLFKQKWKKGTKLTHKDITLRASMETLNTKSNTLKKTHIIPCQMPDGVWVITVACTVTGLITTTDFRGELIKQELCTTTITMYLDRAMRMYDMVVLNGKGSKKESYLCKW